MFRSPTSAEKDYTKVLTFATLTLEVDRPTYKRISKSQHEIFACAGSIETTRVSGAHGNIGLVMAPTAYDLIAPITSYVHQFLLVPFSQLYLEEQAWPITNSLIGDASTTMH